MQEAGSNQVGGIREGPTEAVREAAEPNTAKPAAKASTPQPEASHASYSTVLMAWKMGLVVTASALFGGIAVVLWNRRLLTRMREVEPIAQENLQGRLWEDDL